MRVTVRLFGPLREAAGAKELHVQVPDGASAATLRALLAEKHPEFAALGPRLRVSVNREFAADDARLADGDEVAFLPPVSGGARDEPSGSSGDEPSGSSGGEPSGSSGAQPSGSSGSRCTVSDQPLDADAVAARVAGPDTGGVVTFVGAVRDRSRGHAIEHLEYEAYPEMAVQEMERICDEAGRRWPGTRVAIAHRVGHLAIGDLAVVVVAASAHRAEAFDACRFAIDALKQTVPIWKKEVARDGAYWVDEHA